MTNFISTNVNDQIVTSEFFANSFTEESVDVFSDEYNNELIHLCMDAERRDIADFNDNSE